MTVSLTVHLENTKRDTVMLTNIAVKNAKPKDKPYKLTDGLGLYILVKKTGKYWRYDYRFNNKRKTLALGVYPDVSLEDAREAHRTARKQVLDKADPSHERKIEKIKSKIQTENTFQAIASEWMDKRKKGIDKKKQGWSDSYFKNVSSRLKNNVFPWIGNSPIAEIEAPEILAIIKRMEDRGVYHSAHKVRSFCSQIFMYAIATQRATSDPAHAVKGSMIAEERKHYATITDPQKIGGLLRAIDDYQGEIVTRYALKLAPLVFVRPAELRHAEWNEINFNDSEWLIPAHKMKMRKEHLIPLSKQALEILEAIKPFTGNGNYVFPSIRSRSRPMSENTINASLRRMGYSKEEMTGHGFRAMASTLLNEQGFNSDHIERQLAHTETNKSRKPYNHADYLTQRKDMMQHWANYLDGLKSGAEVVSIIGKKA